MVTTPKPQSEDKHSIPEKKKENSTKLSEQTSKQPKSVACMAKKTPIIHDSWEKPLQKVELKILPEQQSTNHPAKLKRKR